MPELPEVELAVRRLRPHVEGAGLRAIERHHPTARRALSAARAAALVGRRIDALDRRGKYQRFRLDDGTQLVAHFRLDGDWAVTDARHARPRHARATLVLDDGRAVSLVDPRALATLTWHRADDDPFAALGPEPFDPALDGAALRTRLATRRAAIKLVLLDQHVLAGVGNIYAAEALWHAQIHPGTPAHRLSAARVERLLGAVRHALARGLDEPGRARPTEFTTDPAHPLCVYGRHDAPCLRCGAPIRRIVQGARGTWWCPRCQRR